MSAHAQSEIEVLVELHCSKEGLSSVRAEELLAVYGKNKLQESRGISVVGLFLSQFKSPLVWVLIAALMISLVIHEFVDVVVIGVVLIVNAILGFVQEFRAQRAIGAMAKLMAQKAVVLRDGKVKEISAQEVVPGDILVLSEGDAVVADARLLEVASLAVDESALTGESVPVEKKQVVLREEVPLADQVNMVFSGTLVRRGNALAVVVRTGMNSQLGKIANLLETVIEEATPLQKKLKQVSSVLTLAVVVIAIGVFGLGMFRHAGSQSQLLLTAVALAVAAIPEGLPAIVTVGLSLGVQRMAKKNAFIRHLPSVETLGACTVICADKTGTLTQNQLTVKKLFVNGQVVGVSGVGYDPIGVLSNTAKEVLWLAKLGVLNNNSTLMQESGGWAVQGDPTEGALIVLAMKAGVDVEALQRSFPRIAQSAFSSETKMMSTLHQGDKKKLLVVKGAPEVVVGKCTKVLVGGKLQQLSKKQRDEILGQVGAFSKSALRVLGFAYKEYTAVGAKEKVSEQELVFVGLQAMIDPPKKEVKAAIEKCVRAGIKVVMITGDHVNTAKAVAAELGISGLAITGDELEEHLHEIENIGVFARVSPKHKLKIISALKDKGHVVAMTGDGVNDAPALKRADIGIAMGRSGTDVARQASVMVLADDNFATIVAAIEEGRGIYESIRRYVAYLFSGNIAEVLVIFGALLLNLPLPLAALQILWVNVVTDGLPALALSVDPIESDMMARPPRSARHHLFRGLDAYVLVFPLILTIGLLWIFDATLPGGVMKAQTLVFTSLVWAELFVAVSVQSLVSPMLGKLFANKWLWFAVLSSIVLQGAVIGVPFLQKVFGVVALSIPEIGLTLIVGAVGFAYLEVHKLVIRRR